MSTITLYIGSGCPYCQKVTDFITANNIDIPIKDTWQDENARQQLITLNHGKGQVPCLVIDDVPMLESDDIIAKLKTLYRC